MNFDPIMLRTSLIITLSIMLVAIIVKRVKRKVYEASVPAPMHAELVSLEVEYHPSRLHVVISLPRKQLLRTTLLDHQHNVKYAWPEGELDSGMHAFERSLPPLADGVYYLEVSTPTQRTVRQFRLQ